MKVYCVLFSLEIPPGSLLFFMLIVLMPNVGDKPANASLSSDPPIQRSTNYLTTLTLRSQLPCPSECVFLQEQIGTLLPGYEGDRFENKPDPFFSQAGSGLKMPC